MPLPSVAEDMDLWKKARRHIKEMERNLKAADALPLADQKRLLLLRQAADHTRAFAREIEVALLAEEQYLSDGVAFYQVSLLDNSATPILVG